MSIDNKEYIFHSKTKSGERVTGRVVPGDIPQGDHWQATSESGTGNGVTKDAAVLALLAKLNGE